MKRFFLITVFILGLMNAYSQNAGIGTSNRLQTNVQTMPSLLDKIMQLRPVDYEVKYNNPSHKKMFGFIAQEVKQLFPQLVSIAKDTSAGYEGITDVHLLNYSGFAVLAIKAIQEQQQQLNEMKSEMALLKEQNNKLTELFNEGFVYPKHK